MSLAHSNGPRWIRSQKAERERALSGVNPIRQFLAALLGRLAHSLHSDESQGWPGDGSAAAEDPAGRHLGYRTSPAEMPSGSKTSTDRTRAPERTET